MDTPRFTEEQREEPAAAQTLLAIPRNNGRREDHPLARQVAAPAQIHIFKEEEEPLIEPVKLIEELFTEEETRPHHPVDVTDGDIGNIRLQIVPKPLAEDVLQRRPLDQDIEEGRECPRGLAHAPIGERKFRRENADTGILPEHRNHALQTRWLQFVIGIDDEQVLAACILRCIIIARAVAAIAVGLEQPYLRMIMKMRPQRADTVILGMVVDDENLDLACDGLLQQRLHALHRILWRPCGDNDGRDERLRRHRDIVDRKGMMA